MSNLKAYLVTFTVTTRIVAEPIPTEGMGESLVESVVDDAFDDAWKMMRDREVYPYDALVEIVDDVLVPFGESPDDTQKPTDPIVIQLSEVFARRLREYLGDDISKWYRENGDLACDENQIMIDAWVEVFGSEPAIIDEEETNQDQVDKDSDLSQDAMHRAWVCLINPALTPINTNETNN